MNILSCQLPLDLVLDCRVKYSGLKSMVVVWSTVLAVMAGIPSVSAQSIRVGSPGYYQACLVKPEFMRISVMLPQFIRPEIERPNIETRGIVLPDIVKPVILKPEFVRPVLERAEYDNRCEGYIATSLLRGGLNLNYTETGVVSVDLSAARNLALAQQMIGKADAVRNNAGFAMTPRELVKMTSQECSCGNGVNTATTPVVVRR